MNYLILDTNIYYYLCLKSVDSVTAPCLKSIKKLLDDRTISLIVPEIVKVEFVNGIPKRFYDSKQFLIELIKAIDKIYLPLDIIEGDFSWSSVDTIRTNIKKDLVNIKNKFKELDINKQIEPIMQIMNHSNSRVFPMEDIIVSALKRTMMKRAPSHKKESFNDCVIIESLIEYLPENTVPTDTIYFICNNTEDFSDPDDKEKLHADILDDFNKKNIKLVYSQNLAKLLKDVFSQDIKDDVVNYQETFATTTTTTTTTVVPTVLYISSGHHVTTTTMPPVIVNVKDE